MLNQFVFAFSITGPILLLLFIGWSIRRLGLINSDFVTQANALVFNVAMPSVLFFGLSSHSIQASLDPKLMLVGLGGTLLLVAILLVVGRWIPEDERGVFVQGSYRGNLAVLGIALAIAAYGESVLPTIGLYLAVVTTAYNILAIWLLNASGIARHILRNPILIGILAGMLVSYFNIPIPSLIRNTGEYIAGLTLPLALICIGATLEIKSLFEHGRSIATASFFKLLISPVLLVCLGVYFQLEPMQLGVLYFMSASPTATASYIMAKQMTKHGALAAEIVAVTTSLGVLSYTIGIAVLRHYGFI